MHSILESATEKKSSCPFLNVFCIPLNFDIYRKVFVWTMYVSLVEKRRNGSLGIKIRGTVMVDGNSSLPAKNYLPRVPCSRGCCSRLSSDLSHGSDLCASCTHDAVRGTMWPGRKWDCSGTFPLTEPEQREIEARQLVALVMNCIDDAPTVFIHCLALSWRHWSTSTSSSRQQYENMYSFSVQKYTLQYWLLRLSYQYIF